MIRPRFPSCRASRAERAHALAGDEIVREPIATFDHAITLPAPPRDVWPWLAQMGAGRGGWYSWDFVDNGGHPSASTILPEHRSIAPGDVLPAVPGAADAFVVAVVDPPNALVITSAVGTTPPAVSWSFVLQPLPDERTRLLVRVRAGAAWRDLARHSGMEGALTPIDHAYRVLARLPLPMLRAVAGFGHGVMEKRMLRGIRRRVEATAASSRG
jgi:hypothetical protein